MPEQHALRINLIVTGGLYQARCSCGWEGIARYVEDLAQGDASAHAEDVST